MNMKVFSLFFIFRKTLDPAGQSHTISTIPDEFCTIATALPMIGIPTDISISWIAITCRFWFRGLEIAAITHCADDGTAGMEEPARSV